MRLGKDLINKPIITLDEGKMLGKVQDVYLDAGLERVTGLYLGASGLIKRKSQLIAGESVAVLGIDAVLVRDASALTDDASHPQAKNWIRREKLEGREVDTPGGTRLGALGDVIVDAAGKVTAFALGKTYVTGPLADSRMIDRSVVLDTGQEDGRMTVDLTALEKLLGKTPESGQTGSDEINITVGGDVASKSPPDNS